MNTYTVRYAQVTNEKNLIKHSETIWSEFIDGQIVTGVIFCCVCVYFEVFVYLWNTYYSMKYQKDFWQTNIATKFQKVYADKLKMSMFKDKCGHTHEYWYWKKPIHKNM